VAIPEIVASQIMIAPQKRTFSTQKLALHFPPVNRSSHIQNRNSSECQGRIKSEPLSAQSLFSERRTGDHSPRWPSGSGSIRLFPAAPASLLPLLPLLFLFSVSFRTNRPRAARAVGIEQSRLFSRSRTDGAERLRSSRRQKESAKPIGRHSPRAAGIGRRWRESRGFAGVCSPPARPRLSRFPLPDLRDPRD
jgi:hypothetical protein